MKNNKLPNAPATIPKPIGLNPIIALNEYYFAS
jgi:hypothetical protein